MEGPSNFDLTPEKKENEPISKDGVVEKLKTKGIQDVEALEFLQKFTDQKEAQFVQEGRLDARMESLREKAHTLRLADCFAEAIETMRTVAEIAQNEGDTESYDEAMWIIQDRLTPLLLAQQSPARVVSETIGKEMPAEMTLEKSGEKVSRDQVLDAFKKLTGKGTDPADLDENDPEVAEANKLFDRWSVQQEDKTKSDDDERNRHNFEKTMLYVDAGFHDPEYLKDVLGWIFQDAGDVEKDASNPDRVQLRNDMASAMRKIRILLGTV
jgi:hypothetical protein